MLEHARTVKEFVAGRTFDEYVAGKQFRLSVERAIEIVGEAARNVSAEFQSAHPDVPWRKMIAQRHVLAHEYGEIKHERLWTVATVYVPALIEQLEPLIPPPPNTPES
jgi:uncharacterized protein with HEPN domain